MPRCGHPFLREKKSSVPPSCLSTSPPSARRPPPNRPRPPQGARNEGAALGLVIKHAAEVGDGTLERTVADLGPALEAFAREGEACNGASERGTAATGAADLALERWAQEAGVSSLITAASFASTGGRGAMARREIR